MFGALCPGEACKSNNDCASDCCNEQDVCSDSTDDADGCALDKMPLWEVLVIIAIIVLVLTFAVLFVLWLKRKH